MTLLLAQKTYKNFKTNATKKIDIYLLAIWLVFINFIWLKEGLTNRYFDKVIRHHDIT